jgi:hypothetical protein
MSRLPAFEAEKSSFRRHDIQIPRFCSAASGRQRVISRMALSGMKRCRKAEKKKENYSMEGRWNARASSECGK